MKIIFKFLQCIQLSVHFFKAGFESGGIGLERGRRGGLELGQGCGSSKKESQVAAAQAALGDRVWESYERPAAPRKKKKRKNK